ncbi:Flagellum-specific ATP synthase FliI (plasmid) [Sinorhizobium sojae CCBAU 05684]|uniref:Flagellum-specific ATP synthase FliI n=1 Tax=Sinorhizobium sojae CCBAU 05684 TaxID=716928 RepID=A0A249PIH1_9HYPH|nr:FliI/YscN family ATPase [Sinorhizobium sojae]ASY65733.1 Flagellum-specific ATP synthase FliI [Sinorhizobium sojae CCBAU 05684]
MSEALARLERVLAGTQTRRQSGSVTDVSGLLVRAKVAAVRIGELCELREPGRGRTGFAEVVGIEGDTALLSPQGGTRGISVRTEIVPTGREAMVAVGDHLLGSVIDANGNVVRKSATSGGPGETMLHPLHGRPADPFLRRPVDRPFPVGLAAIDGVLTCGEGQRIAILGPPGVGKSTLVSQIIAENNADVVVCALVGERGREVGEFVERVMPAGRSSSTVLVVATSDRPALERFRAVLTATTVAEHFRDRQKRVLLLVDSVTRMARALREIGLAAGEPAVRRGFPPSVFAALPEVFERAGNSAEGTMTAFYTVLVEGEADDDPIAEETRALLDGHIVLSEKIARAGHFPAIDVLASRSRTMSAVVSETHRKAADRLRTMLSLYQDAELLIRVGEYREGRDAALDEAVRKRERINRFLFDSASGQRSFSETIAALEELVR